MKKNLLFLLLLCLSCKENETMQIMGEWIGKEEAKIMM
jgi:hypothetical protein